MPSILSLWWMKRKLLRHSKYIQNSFQDSIHIWHYSDCFQINFWSDSASQNEEKSKLLLQAKVHSHNSDHSAVNNSDFVAESLHKPKSDDSWRFEVQLRSADFRQIVIEDMPLEITITILDVVLPVAILMYNIKNINYEKYAFSFYFQFIFDDLITIDTYKQHVERVWDCHPSQRSFNLFDRQKEKQFFWSQ